MYQGETTKANLIVIGQCYNLKKRSCRVQVQELIGIPLEEQGEAIPIYSGGCHVVRGG